jgi:hypothetical protein
MSFFTQLRRSEIKEAIGSRVKKTYVACSESGLFRVISQVRLIQRPGTVILPLRHPWLRAGPDAYLSPFAPPDVNAPEDRAPGISPRGIP